MITDLQKTFVCVVDQSCHESLEALHKHLRVLKISQERYYTEFAPQRDLCTGQPIPFKAPASRYLETEFLNKINLKRYLKEQPVAGREWSIDWLRKRKTEKNLIFAPCQVELRTLMCPTIPYYDHVGGYNNICEELGYQVRYTGTLPPATRPTTIVVDTREQQPLSLKSSIIRAKLNCGDYGLPAAIDQGIYIERKSLADFIGTLSSRETREGDSNIERFARELERAGEEGAYIIMVVECTLADVSAFPHIPQLKQRLGNIKVTPDHLFHNLRELFHRFSHFQAVFVDGRIETARMVERLLAAGNTAKNVDLQLAYEYKQLISE